MNYIEEKEKEQKKNRRKKILILVLLFLLLFLLFGTVMIISSKLGRIDVLYPTGNVDIFDINICCSDEECEEATKPVVGEGTTDNTVSGDFSIIDNDIVWYNQAELRIFENYAYQMQSIIAPGVSNAYNFIVRNNNSFAISYTFKAYEENEYKVNMKYRLKQNGHYVVGDENTWVSYDELSVANVILAPKSKTLYSLEWKWVDSTDDNIAGTAINAVYKLIMKVNASEYIG